MKWHITSWHFTKLFDFLPFFIYMVEWSLHNKKLPFQMIHNSWNTESMSFFSITEPRRFFWSPNSLIKSGYYVVPSPSTILGLLKPGDLSNLLHSAFMQLHTNTSCAQWNCMAKIFLPKIRENKLKIMLYLQNYKKKLAKLQMSILGKMLIDDYLMTSWWLPDDFLMTAWWLPDDCLVTVLWLSDDNYVLTY